MNEEKKEKHAGDDDPPANIVHWRQAARGLVSHKPQGPPAPDDWGPDSAA
jgi:hypothetical protein